MTKKRCVSLFALLSVSLMGLGQVLAQPHALPAPEMITFAKAAKCSASSVDDYEGTDESAMSKKCRQMLETCIDEKLACEVRKKNCKEFEKNKC